MSTQQKMKIFAFTDTHGNTKYIDKIIEKIEKNPVDYVLCCGDITNFGRKQKEIVTKISKIPSKILLIHGNHEIPDGLSKDCEKFDNITFLHCSAFRDGSTIFFGYGGDGFSSQDATFRKISQQFSKDIKTGDKVVLFFHGPPYKTVDRTFSGNSGNKDYRNFIEKTMPEYVLCGHIHEEFGKQVHIGKTKVINPGPEGMFFEI